MRIVIAAFEATYTGRGDTKLPMGTRAVIIKQDGSVMIHAETGIKPLNYMGKATFTEEKLSSGELLWNFDTAKENLHMRIINILSDVSDEIEGEEPGLIRDGTEDQLQGIIEKNPNIIEKGLKIVEREYQTGAGPIDFLGEDKDGSLVLIEVKRVATTPAIGQVQRYRSAGLETIAENMGEEINVRVMLVSLDCRPKAAALAERRGIEVVTLDRGVFNSEIESFCE